MPNETGGKNEDDDNDPLGEVFIFADGRSGLFGAWDKIGLSQKAIMRNYFMMKGWKPRISMKKAKRITVDEEAAFMSDAAGMDAFAIYREFGISADDKKSVYGWGGFQLKKELTIPHGWTAEELE